MEIKIKELYLDAFQKVYSFRPYEGICQLKKLYSFLDEDEIDSKFYLKRLKLNCILTERYANQQLGIDSSHLVKNYLSILSDIRFANSDFQGERSIHDFITKRKATSFDSPKFLFISGLGRSGTSALGRAVNASASPSFIFTERYPWQIGYCPLMFDKDYVFSKDNYYNRRPKLNESLSKLWGSDVRFGSGLLGDKRPDSIYSLDVTNELFGMSNLKANFIHIIRDPIYIANSWFKRAINESDDWPSYRSYECCYKDYLSQARLAINASVGKYPNINFYMVDFHRIFTDGEYMFNFFKEVFGDEVSISKEKCTTIVNESLPIVTKERKIESKILKFFEEKEDAQSAYELLKRFCLTG